MCINSPSQLLVNSITYLGTTIIGLLVPSNDDRLNLADGTAASSPFVVAIQNAGIRILPSVRLISSIASPILILGQIVNAALLTSAWSAATSDLYTSSRALCKPHPCYNR